MPLKFTKMHGLGNDYIYISLFDQKVSDPPALARAISDRHRGIGSDGLILVAPPATNGHAPVEADVRMEMYNADGSRSQMCGNGIRCVAKFAYERGLARKSRMRVATDAGVLALDLTVNAAGSVTLVRVDMGAPVLEPARIPLRVAGISNLKSEIGGDASRAIGVPLEIDGTALKFTAVSMGNPHAVFFTDELAAVPLKQWGPRIETHPLFPERVNAHFAQVMRRDYVRMITWERGSGATQACGTGASAVCVASVLNGLAERDITVELPGGTLRIAWEQRSNHVFKTGPATHICDGEWPDAG